MMKPEFDRNDRSEEENAGKILCRAGADFVGRNSFFPDTAQRVCDLPGSMAVLRLYSMEGTVCFCTCFLVRV